MRMVAILAILVPMSLACSGGEDTIEDVDKNGDTESFYPPAEKPGSLIVEPQDEAAFLWDQKQVRTFEIEIDEQALDEINSDPVAEKYVAAKLLFGDKVYSNVGVRYKGSFGGWVSCFNGSSGTSGGLMLGGEKTCPKLSMKVSFDWQDPDNRFYGLKKLNFASMADDNSQMRENLGYALFREYELAAPRSMYVRLLINGRLEGLFLLVEEIDGRFTRSHFTEGGDGNIYKEIWPKWMQADDYQASLRSNRNDPNLAIDRIVRFASALEASTDPADVAALSNQWMDNNYIMRYVAADRTILNDDGIFHWYCDAQYPPGNNPGECSNHNYFWYEERGWDRLWLIVWDLPLAFKSGLPFVENSDFMEISDKEISFIEVFDQWNDTNASCEHKTNGSSFWPSQFAPSCDKLVHGWASLKDEYKSAVRAFLDGPFAKDSVDAKLDAWDVQIAPLVDEAATAGQGPPAATWRQALTELREVIDELRADAENRIE